MVAFSKQETIKNQTNEEWDIWKKDGMKTDFQHIIDEHFSQDEYDSYPIMADVLDEFMSNHPAFSEVWYGLNNGQKWSFIQAMMYSVSWPVISQPHEKQWGPMYHEEED